MARFTGIDVPPSLARRFSRIIQTHDSYDSPLLIAQRERKAFLKQSRIVYTDINRRAMSSGVWLASRFVPRGTTQQRRRFAQARASEILAGDWNPDYWHACSIDADKTIRAALSTRPFTGVVSEKYFDAARLQTSTLAYGIAAVYENPAAHSTGAQPSAGWAASVSGGYWRDDWLAARAWLVDLPLKSAKDVPQRGFGHTPIQPPPVWMDAAYTLELSADQGGNWVWGESNVSAEFTYAAELGDALHYRMNPRSSPRHHANLNISPPATPWSQSVSHALRADLTTLMIGGRGSSGPGVAVTITPTPTMGRFWWPNYNAGCWLTASASFFQVRLP